MTRSVDLVIVGAGPAGMSAAIMARRHGLNVLVVDEQLAPGGQIWRAIESVAGTSREAILGKAYSEGLAVVRQFRSCGAQYEPLTQVWQVESGPRVFMARGGASNRVDARCLLLAVGAQERPTPFPGWTLPGVMTVGAAQILLKSSNQIPDEPLWIAGSGPLSLLYAAQLLQAGGRIAGFLDTTPAGRALSAAPRLPAAIFNAHRDLLKGLGWLASLRRHVRYVRNVTRVEALGETVLERVRYATANGQTATVDARVLLVHEGVIPSIHPTLSLGCRHKWNADQDSFAPELDAWGETSEANIFVAGDGAGIGGAIAACVRGEIAALRIAVRVGRLSEKAAAATAKPLHAHLRRLLAARPFLDALYRPRQGVFVPADEAVACRCEEIRAAEIRQQVATGRPGPDQVKASTRAGMGPCQGRQCSYTVANILAASAGCSVSEVGLYRVRPPLKPLTLGELAALDMADAAS